MNRPSFQATRPSAFSRLDFRAKLAVFVAASVAAVLWSDPRLSVGLMLATLGACLWAGVGRTYLWLMARLMAPFFLLLLLTHGFFNVQYVLRLTGHAHLTAVFTLPARLPLVGGMIFSEEGFYYGLAVIAKSTTLLLLVPLCVFTTDPNNLVVGLVRMRVPYALAFAFTSTLRFFPLLFDEVASVIEAQRLRGFAAEELGAVARVRTYAKVAVPVILGALFKAQQVEVVLQSRGFSGRRGRTYLHDSRLDPASAATIALCLLAVGVVIGLRIHLQLGAFSVPGGA
jgi:energy-coupling factor transport system permease protein